MALGPISKEVSIRLSQTWNERTLPQPDPRSGKAFEEMMEFLTQSLVESTDVPFPRNINLGEVLSIEYIIPYLDNLENVESPLDPHRRMPFLNRVVIVSSPTDERLFVFSPIEKFRVATWQKEEERWIFSNPIIDHLDETMQEITGLETAGDLYNAFSQGVQRVFERYNQDRNKQT